MPRRKLLPLLVLAGSLVVLLAAPDGEVLSQSIRQVIVTNWPQIQRVEGTIDIDSPVPLSQLVSFEEIVVPPVRPNDTTRLVDAGMLQTDGFPNVVLSLHGQVKGSVHREGSVGAILIPEEKTIQEAFDELGLMHFTLQATADGVSSRTPYFASDQPRYVVGFESYRILLYNTTDKTVTTNLYAYLTQ